MSRVAGIADDPVQWSLTGLFPLLIGLVLLALAGAAAGIKLAETPSISQRVLPFSGGLLVGIALFWILPEIAVPFGWAGASAGLAIGFTLLWLIDHYIYPVCPTCSHTHDHAGCNQELHGFAAPLLIASGLHSFFDGWSLAVSQQKGFESLKLAFLLGIGAHKLPEGLALGALLAAALGTARRAMLGAAAAQLMMIAGGTLAVVLAPHLGTNWTIGFLSVAAGAFVYLGYHAIDSEYQRRGIRTSVMPALTGAVGAAALRSIVPGM
ncbi:MAG TPA: ZIP family metal transporter [Bryobacteraceae bacterium]|nr:ZIP family metal transporter [Bryobacteraceae bacterium]